MTSLKMVLLAVLTAAALSVVSALVGPTRETPPAPTTAAVEPPRKEEPPEVETWEPPPELRGPVAPPHVLEPEPLPVPAPTRAAPTRAIVKAVSVPRPFAPPQPAPPPQRALRPAELPRHEPDLYTVAWFRQRLLDLGVTVSFEVR